MAREMTQTKPTLYYNTTNEKLWTEVHNMVQQAVTKTIPKKEKCKKAKWLSEEALQQLRKEEKQKAKEKERDGQLNAEFQRIAPS